LKRNKNHRNPSKSPQKCEKFKSVVGPLLERQLKSDNGHFSFTALDVEDKPAKPTRKGKTFELAEIILPPPRPPILDLISKEESEQFTRIPEKSVFLELIPKVSPENYKGNVINQHVIDLRSSTEVMRKISFIAEVDGGIFFFKKN